MNVEVRSFAIVIAAAVISSACLPESTPEPVLIRPVLVHAVEPVSAVQERSFPARAQAGSESLLSFRVPGAIREIFVSVGESVRQGQPIAALDDEDLMLELRRAEAGFLDASARERNSRSELRRMRILYKNQAASANQLDAAETEAASTRATLEAQAQAVALAKSKIGYAELRAPMDGLIASVEVEVNENVGIGDPVVTLNSGGRPEVAFTVPESVIGSMERGQPATVRFTALPEAIFPAEIVEVGVSSGRSAFPITARLLEPDARIRSGMVAETTVRFARRDDAGISNVVVPASAVAEDADGRFVYVATQQPEAPDGSGGLATVERRKVQTADLSAAGLEIQSGLEIGDLVVTAGLHFVEPGMSVRLIER